jgi:hypothetical protein
MILIFAALTGFFGDAFLQVLTANGQSPGLVPYFRQHGSFEALFLASGLMTVFFIVYQLFFPVDYVYLILFGVGTDLLWRWGNLFPSLEGYYKYYSVFETCVYMAASMVLPVYLSTLIKKT